MCLIHFLRRQARDFRSSAWGCLSAHKVVGGQDLARIVIVGLGVRKQRVVIVVVGKRNPALVFALFERTDRTNLGMRDFPQLTVLATPKLGLGAACPVFERTCPECGSTCPVFEATCPEFGVACPVFEMTCPEFGVTCPVFEMTCPVFEMTCPVFEAACPEFEVSVPGV
jgi:hypothetical protein